MNLRISQNTLDYNRKVLNLTWPVIVSNISIPLTGVVDTAVVGHLPDPAYIGAVAMGALIFSTLLWLMGFLRMATTGFVAQSVGANDDLELAAVTLRGFVFACVVGILVLLLQNPIGAGVVWMFQGTEAVESNALDYYSVRVWGVVFALCNLVILGLVFGKQRMRLALFLQLLLNGLNIVLDLLFVLVFDWGVRGVAAATLISETVTFFAGIVIAYRVVGLPWSALRTAPVFSRSKWLALATANVNIFIRTLCIEIAIFYFVWVSAKSGEVVLAANAVLLHLLHFLAYGLDGFAHAAEALVGTAFGARNKAQMRRCVVTTLGWSLVVAGVFCIIYAAGGIHIINMITGIEAVRIVAGEYLIWMVVAPFICVWAFLYDGVYIGTTRTAEMRNAMLISFAVYAPVAHFAYSTLGNHGLWLALMVFMIVRGATLVLWYPRIEALAETQAK